MNQSCESTEDLRTYQHYLYAVVYSVILAPGLLGNVLALWVFRVYVKETKKAVVFMMNLAVADLLQVLRFAPSTQNMYNIFPLQVILTMSLCIRPLICLRFGPQVLSLPLRIYYYLNNSWPFGHTLCMICFYLKYVNMYASIFFLVCVSVRRCELIMRPLHYNSSRRKWDMLICAVGWGFVCLACLLFPLLRTPSAQDKQDSVVSGPLMHSSNLNNGDSLVCFAELPIRRVSPSAAWALLIIAELIGLVIPSILVIACTCLTAWSLRHPASSPIPDRGEKRRSLKMVLSCAGVFLVCFVPYHITMPLDFLVKSNSLENCALRDFVLRCHPIMLCLASLNCSLDPLMYYFMTDEFWRRLSKHEIPDGVTLRRLSCMTVEDVQNGNSTTETSQ